MNVQTADYLPEIVNHDLPINYELFLSRILPPDENGCMIYDGPKQTARPGYSYGIVANHKKRRGVTAHRVSHMVFIGEIPEKYDVDHVNARGCRSTLCVNPAHLEAVTHRENIRRGKVASSPFCMNGRHWKSDNHKLIGGDWRCALCYAEKLSRRMLARRKSPRTAVHFGMLWKNEVAA